MLRPLEKLPRSALRAWALQTLQVKQKGLCRICQKRIDMTRMGRDSDYVVDHCHETGQVRAVLHRSCNAALGKIDNAAGRWGAKSMKYSDIVPYLRQVVAYYDWVNSNPTGLQYPDHKTESELKEAELKKRRTAYAKKKAAEQVKRNANK